jgi:hypothetical protein
MAHPAWAAGRRSLPKLKRLYAAARRKPGARVIVYQEHPFIGDGSIVTATIRNRRVGSFQLWLGAGLGNEPAPRVPKRSPNSLLGGIP